MYREILHEPVLTYSAARHPVELFYSVSEAQKPILFVGGVHGDEPEGVRLATDLLAWLFKNNKDLQSWALIPCLNPDGYKANSRTNGNGVDLNRNFPTPDWVKSDKKDRYFSGERPGSEPETQALIALIKKLEPKCIIHFHSWHPCIVYTGSPGEPYARVLNQTNNYTIKEDIGYPTPGSLGHYGWMIEKTPVICIEEQEKISLDKVWPNFCDGLQEILKKNSV